MSEPRDTTPIAVGALVGLPGADRAPSTTCAVALVPPDEVGDAERGLRRDDSRLAIVDRGHRGS